MFLKAQISPTTAEETNPELATTTSNRTAVVSTATVAVVDTPTSSQPKLVKVINNGATSVDVKRELMQKVMANNKLKEKKQQLQHQQKPSTTADENEPSESVGEPDEDSFVVTPDYIQQSKKILVNTSSHIRITKMSPTYRIAIKNALRQENLNPEIEEKLLNLQRYQEKQMKAVAVEPQETVVTPMQIHQPYLSPVKSSTNSKKRPSSRSQDDDDWVLDTPKRRPLRATGPSDRKYHATTAGSGGSDEVTPPLPIPAPKVIHVKAPPKQSPEIIETPTKSSARPAADAPMNNRRLAAIKRESDKKKQQHQQQVKSSLKFRFISISFLDKIITHSFMYLSTFVLIF